MLMILARLVRSESFWAVVKVRSPHTGPEVCYIIEIGCWHEADPISLHVISRAAGAKNFLEIVLFI